MVPITHSLLMPFVVLLAAFGFLLSWAITARVRRYALANSVLDVPNERSSHVIPTPRGGGIAIVLTSLAGILALALGNLVEWRTALSLGGGGAAVAAIGWVDDHKPVPASIRALVHFAAAGWALAWLGGFPSLTLGAWTLSLGYFGSVLAILGIVWATNLYNFMDGIDGIAGGQAVSAGLTAGALLLVTHQGGLAACAFIIAASCAGFLTLNWPPARIFMGDAGSGFLGFLFATLAVASERSGGLPVLGWVVVLGVFVFDATITLVRRALRGERLYAAHRSHAYQRAVRGGRSHRTVTISVLAINVVLGALALFGLMRPRAALVTLVMAALLLWAAYRHVENEFPMAG